MSDPAETLNVSKSSETPLIFISHDTRDASLAEAFSKLLKSVSAGMLKSFRSSDKKSAEGIEFGDEWYKTLMSKLDTASDVVCLLTERSLDRPWILYEAGVAKGKLGTPVHGLALGVPLTRASTGPFYQFQNSDDTEESLSKLVRQLCNRVSGLEPDVDVVKTQVHVFKSTVTDVLKTSGDAKNIQKKETTEEGAVAKVLEEMKLLVRELPLRLEQIVIEGPIRSRPRRFREFHPMMIEEMAHMISGHSEDPIGLLIVISLLREDFPWLYEVGLEAYHAVKTGKTQDAQTALSLFGETVEFTLRGPFRNELAVTSKESHLMLRELSDLIDRYTHLILSKPSRKRAAVAKPSESLNEE